MEFVPEDLEKVKTLLGQRYLGKAGIHALGIQPAAKAISVYMSPGSGKRHKQILEELRKEAEPFSGLGEFCARNYQQSHDARSKKLKRGYRVRPKSRQQYLRAE